MRARVSDTLSSTLSARDKTNCCTLRILLQTYPELLHSSQAVSSLQCHLSQRTIHPSIPSPSVWFQRAGDRHQRIGSIWRWTSWFSLSWKTLVWSEMTTKLCSNFSSPPSLTDHRETWETWTNKLKWRPLIAAAAVFVRSAAAVRVVLTHVVISPAWYDSALSTLFTAFYREERDISMQNHPFKCEPSLQQRNGKTKVKLSLLTLLHSLVISTFNNIDHHSLHSIQLLRVINSLQCIVVWLQQSLLMFSCEIE